MKSESIRHPDRLHARHRGPWFRTMPSSPSPLPYHRAIVEHLRSTEPALWNWFASSRQRAAEADAVRLDLLKSTYRLDAASQRASPR